MLQNIQTILKKERPLGKDTLVLGAFVVVFQTALTFLMTSVILGTFFFNYNGVPLIRNLLFLDIAFISSHILLRLFLRFCSSRENEARLSLSSKKTLVSHSSMSLLVLLLTWTLITKETDTFFILVTVVLWYTSCVSGILLFIRKYCPRESIEKRSG